MLTTPDSADKVVAFYDQVHTTGMDIKHVLNACAVLTLGKDMTFRDYAQGMAIFPYTPTWRSLFDCSV